MRRAAVVLGFLFLALAAGQSCAGQAKSSFRVGLMIGQGNGWSPTLRTLRTYTRNAAAISVRNAGFDSVLQAGSSDGIYWFRAERNGRTYRVAVSIATGNILDVIVTGS